MASKKSHVELPATLLQKYWQAKNMGKKSTFGVLVSCTISHVVCFRLTFTNYANTIQMLLAPWWISTLSGERPERVNQPRASWGLSVSRAVLAAHIRGMGLQLKRCCYCGPFAWLRPPERSRLDSQNAHSQPNWAVDSWSTSQSPMDQSCRWFIREMRPALQFARAAKV